MVDDPCGSRPGCLRGELIVGLGLGVGLGHPLNLQKWESLRFFARAMPGQPHLRGQSAQEQNPAGSELIQRGLVNGRTRSWPCQRGHGVVLQEYEGALGQGRGYRRSGA